MYASAVDTAEELLQHVQNCCSSVCSTSGMFQHVHQSKHCQAVACVAVQGQHFEHVL
jgi:oligoribonuclease (3'-5' exoribonuclease)